MLPARPHLHRTLVAAALLFALSACTTRPRPLPIVSPPPVTPPPTAPVPPPEPVSPVATPEPPPPAPVEPARVIDPAAAPVIARLARQLRVPAEAIAVAQVAHADWPNACLGLAADGEICAQVITPGFAVSLIANGQRYDFRTDASGRRIRLAFAPAAEIGKSLVSWSDSSSFAVLQIGTERIRFGLRDRAMLVAPLPVAERAHELMGFLSRFAPVYARTPAGTVSLSGVGTTRATALDLRQIAEWARLVAAEAEQGLTQRIEDRAFVWRREGGIAGFCDEVVVSRAGLATARSCRQTQDKPSALVSLNSDELTLLYRWLDTLAPGTWENDSDGAVADALTISVELAGQGTKPPSETDREQMFEFAHALVRRLLTDGTNGTTDASGTLSQ